MAKKSFSSSIPAAMFISEPAEPTTEPQANKEIPAGYRVNYGLVETKSKRVQLLMQPSLHARIKAAAAAQGLSFNDFVHRELEKALDKE